MPEAKSLTNQIKDTRTNCKKEEEKVTEEKEKVSFDTFEEARGQEEEEKMDASKGKVDQILDTLRDICPFCQKRFEDEDQMQKHIMKTHRKPYNCDKCSKGYFTNSALEKHQKTHEVSLHQCSICQKQYKSEMGFRNHQIREHSDINPIFTCDYCGKRFKLKSDLYIHISKMHMKVTQICRFCGKAVTNIQYHELKHEQREKASCPYGCSICPKKFKAWHSLENHLLIHKSPDMLSTPCEKKFRSRNDFDQHAFSQFAFQDKPRNHVASHSQTYLCSYCGKNFTTNDLLKLHLHTHTGERPYQCETCLKTFARSSSLWMHKIIHTGKRPYVCDLCGRSFTQKGNMMIHRRKHPGDHPPPPRTRRRRK